jgi:hypothetical protein
LLIEEPLIASYGVLNTKLERLGSLMYAKPVDVSLESELMLPPKAMNVPSLETRDSALRKSDSIEKELPFDTLGIIESAVDRVMVFAVALDAVINLGVSLDSEPDVILKYILANAFAPMLFGNPAGNLITVVVEPVGTVPVIGDVFASNVFTVNECVVPFVLSVESL